MNHRAEIEKLSWEELQSLLKEVKLYKQLRKQLGNRWKILFSHMKNNTSYYKVEYFPEVGLESAWEQAQKVFQNVFNISVEREAVIFEENIKLLGWIQVYKDDMVADLSYWKIENALR